MMQTDRPANASRAYRTDYLLAAFMTGAGDGLIIPFALLAGGTSIVNASGNIVPFILVFIMLAALLMAAGNYFTTKKEQYEKHTSPQQKMMDTRRFFANLDLPEEIQEQSAKDMLKENEIWDRMDERENTIAKSPAVSGFITGASYMAGGFLSLLPFVFIEDSVSAMKISAMITLPALFIIGYFKNRDGALSPWLAALRLMFTGVVAAIAAFWIAKLL